MVLLTAYYLFATGVQSWRLRSIYQKIAKVIDTKNTVVFLRKTDESTGLPSELTPSDLSVNFNEATVSDCFWSNDASQGMEVTPKQLIYLKPFVAFPQSPGPTPFKFTHRDVNSNEDSVIYALVETDLIPLFNQQDPALKIESFGKLIAWKVDSSLAIIIETDGRNFSQLILNTFHQNNYLINDHLPVFRVQTVDVNGSPQDFDEIMTHSRKGVHEREGFFLTPEEWDKHFDVIRNLSRLANQASEFEVKKNLTEGKTGIVQPDLISSKTIEESLLKTVTSPDTPKKKLLDLEKTDEKINSLKVEYKMQELLKSPVNPTASFPSDNGIGTAPKAETPESPKFPSSTATKSPGPSIKSKVSSEPLSPKFPTSSPAKSPTPSIKSDSKFHIASPLKVATSSDKPSIVKMEPKTVEAPHEVDEKKLISTMKETTSNFITAEKESISPVVAKEDVPETSKPKPVNLPPIETSKPQPESQVPAAFPQSKSSYSKSQKLISSKPPNILVFSDSITTRGNVIKTLGSLLQKNTYTVYALTSQQARNRVWLDNATLLIVCGSVNGSDVGTIFLDYFFKGGKVLCLCSDLLRYVLPTYHTAEVREHELVQFSYGKWKNIKMMHHIFCYQPSPVRKNFSLESDEPPKERLSSAENPSVELKDQFGIAHSIKVETLGTEDTWKTPSLLMVYKSNGGKIIFSQIHLEIDPSLYENDDQKYQVLLKSDNLRHEIFADVLSSHLGLKVTSKMDELSSVFSKGFLLGKHELKFEVLGELKMKMETPNTLKLDGLTIKFCGKNDDPPTPEAHCLPLMIHSCPDDFSTLDYFDTLKTEHVGRLLIYSKVLASSSVIVNKVKYCHGFAVIPKELTAASGRGNNQWLSPPGCLMFSLQLHIPLKSPLGEKISLIQHLVATAVVEAIHKLPGYATLDIKLKWPNDIYANSDVKIGGLIVTSVLEGDLAICNIGLGVNLSNSIPTTCINDLITSFNKNNSRTLPLLTYEKTLALIFNEIEIILNRVQAGDLEFFYDLYYKCWLHSGSVVTVMSANGQEKSAKILGIDDFGFLKIQLDNNKVIESVQPDGNSFDMLSGLIIPKTQ